MPHCQICDFCETTETRSNYYSEFEQKNNKVRYRPTLDQWLCNECVTSMQLTKLEYNEEAYYKGLVEEQRFTNIDLGDVDKNAPAMSEL